MKTVVLGAGAAGLAYISHASTEDKVVLYEKCNHIGGLCHSFQIQGFTFDSAVHLLFADEKDIVRRLWGKTKHYTHSKPPYNYDNGRWIKHPVIHNTSCLSTEEKCRLIESFIARDIGRPVNNYEDWLYASYGEEFAEAFYNRYTRKYWRMESAELSTSWIGIRLAEPDLHKVLYGSYEEETGTDYYAKEFWYPSSGRGYQDFLNPFAADQDIHTGKEVIQIDPARKIIRFQDGGEDIYDRLVSSLPLCELPALVEGTPDRILGLAEKLLYSKVCIVSVGFSRADIAKYLYMYIYDEDIWAARVNSPSCKCSANVPPGCSSLQFEIYYRNNEVIDQEAAIENVRYSLEKMGLYSERDILFMESRILPYGNVIFYHGMEKDRDEIKSYMKSRGIELIGRFGEWDYLWSTQSFLSGYRCAERHQKQGKG